MYWGKGRQLMRIQNGENEYLYTYNASGIRTSKTVGGVKHSFTLDGAKILRDNWTETDENGNTYEANMTFLYDNEDTVCGFQHNAIMYYYLKNLQGDVIAIVDESGTTVARYTYDAWGACTVSYDATATATGETEPVHIATVNPFRYRSYYFDTETGLYYLQSRYYDPALGRFLNGDEPQIVGILLGNRSFGSCNLFGYCLNNPVNDCDLTGCLSAKQVSNMVTASTIFTMFLAALLVNYSKGLVVVGAYVTKVVSPVVIKLLWWKPLVAAAIIAAAVLLVVAVVAIIYANHQQQIGKIKNRIPNKLMKNGKVDLSKFNNPNGPKGSKGGRGILGPLGWYILKDIDKHKGSIWKLFNRVGERIASLLEDGTIVGK